jgi:hypothetical protein
MFTTSQGLAVLVGIIGIGILGLCIWSIVDYEIECRRNRK